MASATLTNTIWPTGTSVGAYLKREQVNGRPIDSAPLGTAAATETVSSTRTLTFTGLSATEQYVASAAINGAWKSVTFWPDEDYQATGNSPEEDETITGNWRFTGITSVTSSFPNSDIASDSQLSTHEADTTAVHGIANTALLAYEGDLVYNVKDSTYGATGDGTTDDRAAIQAAINAAATAGGGIVFLPKGTYRVTLADHSENADYKQGLVVKNAVTLKGAGIGATVIQLAASQTSASGTVAVDVIRNNQITAGGDAGIVIEDLTVDGNAANNASADGQGGINFIRARRVKVQRVHVKNCRGTGSSGFQESFGFEFQLGSDAQFIDCLATRDAGSTASGFSANSAVNVSWTRCLASGMTVAHGFTHNGCRNLVYTSCFSHDNTLYGFNSEVSIDVVYNGCIAGGVAPSAAAVYPFTTSESLGNTGLGFAIAGGTRVSLVGCISRSNGNTGFFFSSSSVDCSIIGGASVGNTNYGVDGSSVTGLQVIGVSFSGNSVGETTGTIDVLIKDPGSRRTYAATNVTTDRAFDANATTTDELADVLGTLLSDLRAYGLVL